jgi:hypothetical protein
MAERPTIRAIDTLIVAGKSSQAGPHRPNPCMSWAVDPETGKPVARWVSKRAEAVENAGLSSAA